MGQMSLRKTSFPSLEVPTNATDMPQNDVLNGLNLGVSLVCTVGKELFWCFQTLKMASPQAVETSVTSKSSFQNYSYPDYHTN